MDIPFVQNPIFASQQENQKTNADVEPKPSVAPSTLKIILVKNSEWRDENIKGKELNFLPHLKFSSILAFATKALSLPSTITKFINFATLTEISNLVQLVELIHSSPVPPKVIALIEDETLEEKKEGKEEEEKPQKTILPNENLLKKLSSIFPSVSSDSIIKVLIKTRNDLDEATLQLLESGAIMVPETEEESEDEEMEEKEENDEFTLVSIEDAQNMDWYQEALINMQEYNSFMNQKKLIESTKLPLADVLDDEALARRLQQEEDDAFAVQALWKQIQIHEGKSTPSVPSNKVVIIPAKGTSSTRNISETSFKEVPKIVDSTSKETKAPTRVLPPPKALDLNGFNVKDKIQKDFRKIGIKIHSIQLILNETLHDRFMNSWQNSAAKNESLFPVFVYHGTAPSNIENITEKGLLIPGKGNSLKVVHGSAHGLGIYLAFSPQTSLSYVGEGDRMLVCAALVGNRFVTTNNGNILVITNPAQVLPCFVVRFGNHSNANANVAIKKPDSLKTQQKLKKRENKEKEKQKQKEYFK